MCRAIRYFPIIKIYHMKSLFFVVLLVFSTHSMLSAQEATHGAIVGATEFAIPASPAFDLLGVNPSLVTRPSNIKDFKVDWSFRSWRLKPNLALQTQPFWELLYNRPNLERYRKASRFMRTLSTIDFSAGTVEDDNLRRRLSWAVKINLYTQRDPLYDKTLYRSLDSSYLSTEKEFVSKLAALQKSKLKAKTVEQHDSIAEAKDLLLNQLDQIRAKQKEDIQLVAKNYLSKFWNSSFLDFSIGKVYSYENDSLKNLKLSNEGFALWLNACVGIGKKFLVSSVAKYALMNVMEKDDLGNQIQSLRALSSAGLNVRYGSSKFNFFVEGLYSNSNKGNTIEDANANISQLSYFSVSYGGDWRINRNIVLSYGVRTDYTKDLKFKNLIPVASLACMMR